MRCPTICYSPRVFKSKRCDDPIAHLEITITDAGGINYNSHNNAASGIFPFPQPLSQLCPTEQSAWTNYVTDFADYINNNVNVLIQNVIIMIPNLILNYSYVLNGNTATISYDINTLNPIIAQQYPGWSPCDNFKICNFGTVDINTQLPLSNPFEISAIITCCNNPMNGQTTPTILYVEP